MLETTWELFLFGLTVICCMYLLLSASLLFTSWRCSSLLKDTPSMESHIQTIHTICGLQIQKIILCRKNKADTWKNHDFTKHPGIVILLRGDSQGPGRKQMVHSNRIIKEAWRRGEFEATTTYNVVYVFKKTNNLISSLQRYQAWTEIFTFAYRDKMDRQLSFVKTVAGWKGFPTSGCDFRKRNIYCGFEKLEKSSWCGMNKRSLKYGQT